MKVSEVSLFLVRLPLVHDFETSSHRKSHLDHVVVKMTTTDGLVGWGEIASPSDPWFSSETVETSLLVAERYLIPAVLMTEWDEPAQLASSWARIRGHEFAKAGFDIAAWDLYAQAQGISLSTALGGDREFVEAGVSMGIESSVDTLLTQVQHQVDAGYRRVKLKIKPGWDVAPTRAVRTAFPSVLVHVDANAAYHPDDASMSTMHQLDRLGIALIEQPFGSRDFSAHARLQLQVETPVCLDETVVTVEDLDTAIELGACRSVNIKVSRMGGLTVALEAHRRAHAAELIVWCGGMHEFGIGRAANVALSALSGFDYPSDVSGSEKYYAQDIIDPPVVAVDGMVAVSHRIGLGHTVLEERVRALSILERNSR